MARFRKVRRIFRRSGQIRRSGRSNGSVSPLKLALAAAVYGAVRNDLHNATAPLTNKIPVPYGDEIAYAAAGWYMSKKGGMFKAAGTAILLTEAALLGAQVRSGGFNLNTANTPQSVTFV